MFAVPVMNLPVIPFLLLLEESAGQAAKSKHLFKFVQVAAELVALRLFQQARPEKVTEMGSASELGSVGVRL
jgi:hypothetical protein